MSLQKSGILLNGVMALAMLVLSGTAFTAPVWSFDTDLQGWAAAEPVDGDVQATWNRGAMAVSYFANAGDPATVDNPGIRNPGGSAEFPIDLASYPYIVIDYQAANWPAGSKTVIANFTGAGGLYNITFDATQTEVAVAHGQTGTATGMWIQMPGSGEPLADWLGASLRIDKIELRATVPVELSTFNTE